MGETNNQSVAKIGTFGIWKVINAKTAVKAYEKTQFKSKYLLIPEEVRWYFDTDMDEKQKRIIVVFEGIEYPGVIKKDKKANQMKICWDDESHGLFKDADANSDKELMFMFIKNTVGEFVVEFIEGNDKQ